MHTTIHRFSRAANNYGRRNRVAGMARPKRKRLRKPRKVHLVPREVVRTPHHNARREYARSASGPARDSVILLILLLPVAGLILPSLVEGLARNGLVFFVGSVAISVAALLLGNASVPKIDHRPSHIRRAQERTSITIRA